MKHQLLLSATLLAAMAALTGCDENAWNDHLKGFDDTFNPTDVKTIEYTLTEADYKAIASNSTNKALAAVAGKADALALVGKKFCFSPDAPAADYVPAFLASTSFANFTLTDGSAVKLTYNVAQDAPECLAQASAATELLLTDEQYQAVWESDEDFIAAFAPSHPASKSLPAILKESLPDAEAGQYALVTYAESDQEPVFAQAQEPEEPAFPLSSTIVNATVGEDIQISGVITAICARGYTVTDASGSIFVYVKSGFEPETHPVGTQVTIAGPVSSYNLGLQVDGANMEETLQGMAATMPTFKTTYTNADIEDEVDNRINAGANFLAEPVSLQGTISISGTYTNIILPGIDQVQGSPYWMTSDMQAKFVDGEEVTVEGMWIAITNAKKTPHYVSFLVTAVKDASGKAKVQARGAAAQVPTQVKYALYQFNGTKWSLPSNFVVVNPADYTAMGQKYGNLDSKSVALLPTWLKLTFPYAQADDYKYVMYKYYNGSSTSNIADQFNYDGSAWTAAGSSIPETAQFVRASGKWMYDPNVTITLTAGKGQALSAQYYQACVDWVYNNICVPLGDTSITSGKFYVTSYGNNEYYSGTSAYQNNVDLRAGSARSQYAAGWEGYTDEEIVATMKHRFTHEVLPGALQTLQADAKPIPGLQVVYTINFSAYNGSTTDPYVVRYQVTGPATFEFLDCSWDTPE